MNVTVGMEIAVRDSGGHVNFGYNVTKVTASGQVVIRHKNCTDSYTRRFDNSGSEMGRSVSKWRRSRLVLDVDTAKADKATETRCRDAADAILKVRVDRSLYTYGKENLERQVAELQVMLDNAKALVNRI